MRSELFRDRFHALVPVDDLVHAALPLEILDGLLDFTAGELLDRFLERRVVLPDDLLELRCPHPCFLQLLKWPARFHPLMLPDVAHQDHSITVVKSVQEFVHLLGACQTRFVDKIEMPFSVVLPVPSG
jgi:hypothetical protein